jgi:hypothetical protein
MKWQVRPTKSKKRWVAWRTRQKRRTGKVFESWDQAVAYALCMWECDRKSAGGHFA